MGVLRHRGEDHILQVRGRHLLPRIYGMPFLFPLDPPDLLTVVQPVLPAERLPDPSGVLLRRVRFRRGQDPSHDPAGFSVQPVKGLPGGHALPPRAGQGIQEREQLRLPGDARQLLPEARRAVQVPAAGRRQAFPVPGRPERFPQLLELRVAQAVPVAVQAQGLEGILGVQPVFLQRLRQEHVHVPRVHPQPESQQQHHLPVHSLLFQPVLRRVPQPQGGRREGAGHLPFPEFLAEDLLVYGHRNLRIVSLQLRFPVDIPLQVVPEGDDPQPRPQQVKDHAAVPVAEIGILHRSQEGFLRPDREIQVPFFFHISSLSPENRHEIKRPTEGIIQDRALQIHPSGVQFTGLLLFRQKTGALRAPVPYLVYLPVMIRALMAANSRSSMIPSSSSSLAFRIPS